MSKIDTIPALMSLLRASPRFYQVFRSRREYLVTQLALNHFHPQILDDVMGLASALQLSRPADRKSVHEYLSKPGSSQLHHRPPAIALSAAVPFCKVAETISWFVEDYRHSTLELLAKLGKDMELVQDPHILHAGLSVIEKCRLQRAFCRFETFCCLFVALKDADTQLRPNHTYETQSRWFLREFTPDEVEEIASIRDYLIRRLWHTIEAVEEDAMVGEITEQVRKLGKDCSPHDWFSFHAKLKHSQYMEYLMAQGLGFLKRVFTNRGLHRAELVIADSAKRTDFLTDALQPLDQIPSLDPEHYDDGKYDSEEEEFEEDDVDALSQGLLWANNNKVPEDYARWPLKGLRDWGYVFWDSPRLKASGVLDKK
ncbi:MAG: hypothetical protein Q9209_006116 [Squamulea sp. 1 TL-2023]